MIRLKIPISLCDVIRELLRQRRQPLVEFLIRVVGLVSSVIAVVALGLTVLAGNRNLGGNETITQPQQIFLLLAAAALLVVQAALFLIHRRERISTKPGDIKDSGSGSV
jgi:hypothetical protein